MVFISAIGTANPKNCQDQNQLIDFMKTKLNLSAEDYRFLKKIYCGTGIETRYSVLNDPNLFTFPSTKTRMLIYKKHALSLAIEAIEDCLKNVANFNIESVTHLITVSCTGMYAPGIDIEIIEKLKLPSHTHRISINFMGCYGSFSALKMAKAICSSTPEAKVLVVSVELCSLHLQKKTDFKDNIIASSLFADGAAAALVENEPSSNAYLALNDFYCNIISDGKKDMAWEIGDTGFEINLTAFVPKLIHYGIKSFMQNALQQFELNVEDIKYYAIHPGSQKILKTCDEVLNIQEHQSIHSYEILRKYGNMSSATILFVLKLLMSKLKEEQFSGNIFSCGFGPGLAIESMLLRYHYQAVH